MPDAWTEGIPPRSARSLPRIDVLTPTYYRAVEATLLTARVFVRRKHFDRATHRPYPCPDPGECPECRAGRTAYITGFVACCCVRSNRPVILQLSDAALGHLEDYAKTGPLLRGLMVKTSRQDARPNAKMRAEVTGRDPRESLIAEYDPRPVLETIWGEAAAKLLRGEEIGGKHDTTRARRARRER